MANATGGSPGLMGGGTGGSQGGAGGAPSPSGGATAVSGSGDGGFDTGGTTGESNGGRPGAGKTSTADRGGAGGSNGGGSGTSATGGRGGMGGRTDSAGRGGMDDVNAGGGMVDSKGGAGGAVDPNTLPTITVHLAGDSTMANYASTTTQEGWGQELGQFFIGKVTIDNQAEGGANVQTFYAGRWKTLIANVHAGDYVLAAFGINDSGTTHGPVSVPDFSAEFNTMADEVAAKNATFIPTTSSPLQMWAGGMETNDRLQPYCDATIAVGEAKHLLVDDLNARGIEYYDSIGQTAAMALTFNGDKAHFDKAGAAAMAQLAAQELKRIGSPLADFLK